MAHLVYVIRINKSKQKKCIEDTLGLFSNEGSITLIIKNIFSIFVIL